MLFLSATFLPTRFSGILPMSSIIICSPSLSCPKTTHASGAYALTVSHFSSQYCQSTLWTNHQNTPYFHHHLSLATGEGSVCGAVPIHCLWRLCLHRQTLSKCDGEMKQCWKKVCPIAPFYLRRYSKHFALLCIHPFTSMAADLKQLEVQCLAQGGTRIEPLMSRLAGDCSTSCATAAHPKENARRWRISVFEQKRMHAWPYVLMRREKRKKKREKIPMKCTEETKKQEMCRAGEESVHTQSLRWMCWSQANGRHKNPEKRQNQWYL